MFKTIVVALDGSRSSAEAFGVALRAATADGSKLAILSVVDPVSVLGHWPLDPVEALQLETVKRRAAAIVDEAVAKASGAGIVAEGRVLIGTAGEEIIGYAAAASADAVVVGTHGLSGYKRLSIGSVAEDVLRSAPCPVMLVRENAHLQPSPEHSVIGARKEPAFLVRLIRVEPSAFERLYGDIATFLRGPGSEIPGCLEAQLFGSDDSTRIAIVAEFRSHGDWVRAQWNERLGDLLEDIAANSETLDFNLYRRDRFGARRTSAASPAESAPVRA